MVTKNTTTGVKGAKVKDQATAAAAKNGKLKPAKTKPAAKNGKATAQQSERKPRAKKEGLRVGQTRILERLAKIKGKGGLTCQQLAEECCNGHEGWTRHFLGSDKPEGREMNRKYLGGKETLQCLKAIEMFEGELDSRTVRLYRITSKGRDILKAQQKLDSGK